MLSLELGPLEKHLISDFLLSKVSLCQSNLFIISKTGSHVAQVKMTLNSWSSCFYFPSVGITGMHHHTQMTLNFWFSCFYIPSVGITACPPHTATTVGIFHDNQVRDEEYIFYELSTHRAASITVLRYFCNQISNHVRSVCYSIGGESNFS